MPLHAEVVVHHLADGRQLGVPFWRPEVSTAEVEVRDEGRIDRRHRVADLVDRRPDPVGDLGELGPVETEDADDILAEHQAQLVLGNVRERIAKPLLRVGPGALGVRIIATERDGLDTDLVTHPDLGAMHEGHRCQAVAVPVLGRHPCCRKITAVTLEHRVEIAECRRDPVGSDFRHDEFQVRVAVEDAAEHQLPHRPPGLDIGEELSGEDLAPDTFHDGIRRIARSIEFGIDRLDNGEVPARFRSEASVYEQRQAPILTQRPDRFPVFVEQRGHVGRGHETRRVGADEAVVGDPLELGECRVEVVAGTAGADEEHAAAGSSERVGDPPVVRARTPASQTSKSYRRLNTLWNSAVAR